MVQPHVHHENFPLETFLGGEETARNYLFSLDLFGGFLLLVFGFILIFFQTWAMAANQHRYGAAPEGWDSGTKEAPSVTRAI